MKTIIANFMQNINWDHQSTSHTYSQSQNVDESIYFMSCQASKRYYYEIPDHTSVLDPYLQLLNRIMQNYTNQPFNKKLNLQNCTFLDNRMHEGVYVLKLLIIFYSGRTDWLSNEV